MDFLVPCDSYLHPSLKYVVVSVYTFIMAAILFCRTFLLLIVAIIAAVFLSIQASPLYGFHNSNSPKRNADMYISETLS